MLLVFYINLVSSNQNNQYGLQYVNFVTDVVAMYLGPERYHDHV